MNTQPKALRLADALEELDVQFSHTGLCGEAAAELRRLHEWVGLTEREVELIDEMIETQLLHAERCDHMANSTMAQKQKAWDLERVDLLRKLKEKNT